MEEIGVLSHSAAIGKAPMSREFNPKSPLLLPVGTSKSVISTGSVLLWTLDLTLKASV